MGSKDRGIDEHDISDMPLKIMKNRLDRQGLPCH
jgi:hypothetical protein